MANHTHNENGSRVSDWMQIGNELVYVTSVYCSCGSFVRYIYGQRVKAN